VPPKVKEGIHLIDVRGVEIEPSHARIALAGDVFLSWDPKDLPPQGSRVRFTIEGTVKPGLQVKPVRIEDSDLWASIVKVVGEQLGDFEVLSAPPPEEGELPYPGDDPDLAVTIKAGDQEVKTTTGGLHAAARRAGNGRPPKRGARR
jgi:hypothetical protein